MTDQEKPDLPSERLGETRDVDGEERDKERQTISHDADLDVTHQWAEANTNANATGDTSFSIDGQLSPSFDSSSIEKGGYEILETIGQGGMGVVYKARDVRLKRLVALKMILAGGHARPEQLTRFRAEAETVARLQHPNIVQIYDFGELSSQPYLAFELIEGGDLSDFADTNSISVRMAAELVESISRGIHYAHERGVIHRDLKPGNILLAAVGDSSNTTILGGTSSSPSNTKASSANSKENSKSSSSRSINTKVGSAISTPSGLVPKITDFGLAKQLDSDGDQTRTGAILGTPHYMAPEQASGKIREIGPGTDVYALGAILYWLLVGRPPFIGDSPVDTLLQVRAAEPVPPTRLRPKLPRDLETICLKCLEKAPAKRYPTAAELADDLRRFLTGEPILARPVGAAERVWKWSKRYPAVAALIIVLAIASPLLGWKWWESARTSADLENANAKLGNAIRQTKDALVRAENAEDDALGQRDAARVREAELTLEQGLETSNSGDPIEGVHWLLRSLEAWPETATAQRNLIRSNLHARLREIPALDDMFQHNGRLHAIALDPKSRYFVTGDHGGQVIVWDWETREVVRNLGSLAGAVQWIALDETGSRLMVVWGRSDSTGDAGGARVWSMKDGHPTEETLDIEIGHGVSRCAFSHDGRLIATGRFDAIVNTWDAETGALIGEATTNLPRIRRVAFSPDDQRLLTVSTSSSKGQVQVWNRSTLESEDLEWTIDDGAIPWDAGFTRDGKHIVIGDTLGRVQFLNVADRQLVGDPLQHAGAIMQLSFSPDGRMLLAASSDGATTVWDTFLRRRLTQILSRGGAHATALSHDAKELIAGQGDGLVRVYRLPRRLSRPATTRGGPRAALWLADVSGSPMALADSDTGRIFSARNQGEGVVRAWDATGGFFIGPPMNHSWNTIRALALSPDGSRLAVGGYQAEAGLTGFIRIWDTESIEPVVPLILHSNYVSCLDFHPSGRYLVAGDYHGLIRVWDAETGEQVGSPMVHDDIVLQVRFLDDNRLVSTTAHDHSGQAKIWSWDFENREVLARSPPQVGAIHHLRVSQDGTMLLAAADSDACRLWAVDTMEPIGGTLELSQDFGDAAFSPDGKFIAIGSGDGVVRLFSTIDGSQLYQTMEHDVSVRDLAIDSNSRRLLVGCADGSTWLWDIEVGRVLSSPYVLADGVLAVGFYGSDSVPWSISGDETVRRWANPTALQTDAVTLKSALPVITGRQLLENGATNLLTPELWRVSKDDYETMATAKRASLTDNSARDNSARDNEWHESAAQDAEQDRDGFGTLWHLNRLMEKPDDWRVLGRMSRAAVWQNDVETAEELASRAEQLANAADQGQSLQDWYRHCLLDSRRNLAWGDALFFVNRLDVDDDWKLLVQRSQIKQELGQVAAAKADMDRAVELADDPSFLISQIPAKPAPEDWPQIVQLYSRVTAQSAIPLVHWYHYSLAMLNTDDAASYRLACSQLVEQLSAMQLDTGSVNLLAWLCAIGPAEKETADKAAALVEAALDTIPQDAPSRYALLNTLGAVLYRAEKFDQAKQRLEEAVAANGKHEPQDFLWLALVEKALGEEETAQMWIDKFDNAELGEQDPWSQAELELLRAEFE